MTPATRHPFPQTQYQYFHAPMVPEIRSQRKNYIAVAPGSTSSIPQNLHKILNDDYAQNSHSSTNEPDEEVRMPRESTPMPLQKKIGKRKITKSKLNPKQKKHFFEKTIQRAFAEVSLAPKTPGN